ncbi:MAG TPA: hypothetical protein VHV10_14080, partial [Ktedonobacteraceae bacterium]|nr:hypothetical protein [Ktedonobacteraceae bacterium]
AKEPQDWIQTGMILASMMVALISFLTVRSRKLITADLILKLTLVFAVAIPFFMPQMHERYFYLADVVSIIYAFCFPRYFYVAIIEQLCSCMSVIPSLFAEDPAFNLAYVAFAVLFIIIIALADLVKTLFPIMDGSATMPSASSDNLSSKASDNGISPKVSSDRDSSKDF